MSTDILLSIANLLLPEFLVTYFKLTKHEVKEEEVHFYFTESNLIPEEFEGIKLHSKVFFSISNGSRFPYSRQECLPSYSQT